jgi:hypothetical protein
VNDEKRAIKFLTVREQGENDDVKRPDFLYNYAEYVVKEHINNIPLVYNETSIDATGERDYEQKGSVS